MPCYRCGTRQGDPEPGKGSPWRRGVIREHQVLICPACQPAALAELSRCPGCGSAHLIRRLDQVECLDCRLTRDAEPESAPAGTVLAGTVLAGTAPAAPSCSVTSPAPPSAPSSADSPAPPATDLASEVARALDKVLGRR